MGTDSNLWTGVCIILLTYTYVYYISSRLTIGQEIFLQIQRGIWVGNVGAIMAKEYVHVVIGNVCRHTCRKGCVFDKKQAKVKSLLVHVIKSCLVHTCILILFMTCIAVGKKVPR